MLIVSDGRALTLVDYDVNQVSAGRSRTARSARCSIPTRDVKKFGAADAHREPRRDQRRRSRTRKQPEYGDDHADLHQAMPVPPGGLKLTSWVALDAQNQRTTVRLCEPALRHGRARQHLHAIDDPAAAHVSRATDNRFVRPNAAASAATNCDIVYPSLRRKPRGLIMLSTRRRGGGFPPCCPASTKTPGLSSVTNAQDEPPSHCPRDGGFSPGP